MLRCILKVIKSGLPITSFTFLSFHFINITVHNIYLMMRINPKISTHLTSNLTYGFAGLPFGKKRVAVKSDLPKYDVVIAGGHLGPILSNHLDGAVGQRASIFVAYDTPAYNLGALRGFYEKGLFASTEIQASPKNNINKFAASSDGLGVIQFLPNQNAVILKGGRKIEYEQLVIATGLKEDSSLIKGFNEAWLEEEQPFYTNQNHSGWKYGCSKPYRFMYNFNGGQAIFYIPPAPFHGEIEAYNFLMAKDLWDRQDAHGRLCWANSRFTVVNANNSFMENFNSGDAFIKSEIEKRGINVEYGLKLVQVNKETQTAIFENTQTGAREERPYNNFYSLMPAKPDPIISEAGLADAQGLLDVDPFTLQHKRYNNIFGMGDIVNAPTSKNFFAGFNQLHVVRNNIERNLNGLDLNAKYDGYSQAILNVGYDEMCKVSHSYNHESMGSLTSGFMASLNAKWFTKNKKSVLNLVQFKSWGPPYYKMKKSFGGGSSTPKSNLGDLEPERKQA